MIFLIKHHLNCVKWNKTKKLHTRSNTVIESRCIVERIGKYHLRILCYDSSREKPMQQQFSSTSTGFWWVIKMMYGCIMKGIMWKLDHILQQDAKYSEKDTVIAEVRQGQHLRFECIFSRNVQLRLRFWWTFSILKYTITSTDPKSLNNSSFTDAMWEPTKISRSWGSTDLSF